MVYFDRFVITLLVTGIQLCCFKGINITKLERAATENLTPYRQ